jgi:hypothetical protein
LCYYSDFDKNKPNQRIIMLHNIKAQTLNFAAQAGLWIQEQIAVAKTSQYGVVRFLASNATPKTAIVTAIGLAAAFCFGKAVKNYCGYSHRLVTIPQLGQGITDPHNARRSKLASDTDILDYTTARAFSKTQPVAQSHRNWAICWAITGAALTAAAVAAAVLLPTP